MSGWMLACRALAQRGGSAKAADLYEFPQGAADSLQHARELGLVNSSGVRGWACREGGPWTLTEKGWKVIDGRLVKLARSRRPGVRCGSRLVTFRPTWLDSLPRDIRLGAPGWEP